MHRKYKDLPVLYTHDYSEITEDYLTKEYQGFKDKKYDFSNMFLSSHSELSQTMIKGYGNYWCMSCTGKPFYIGRVAEDQ